MKTIDAHDESFYKPLIVQVLMACPEKKARAAFVLEIIQEYMKDRFTEADLEPLKVDKKIRWKKRVYFAKMELLEEGLIENVRYGIWQLTAKGIEIFGN